MTEKRTNQGKWVSDLHVNKREFKIINGGSATKFVLPTSILRWHRNVQKD